MSETAEPCCADPKCDGVACKQRPARVLTMDEARAWVGRQVCATLRASVEQVTAQLALAAEQPELFEDDAEARQHAELVLRAAQELHDSVLLQVRRLERPLVLRPRRALRVK